MFKMFEGTNEGTFVNHSKSVMVNSDSGFFKIDNFIKVPSD